MSVLDLNMSHAKQPYRRTLGRENYIHDHDHTGLCFRLTGLTTLRRGLGGYFVFIGVSYFEEIAFYISLGGGVYLCLGFPMQNEGSTPHTVLELPRDGEPPVRLTLEPSLPGAPGGPCETEACSSAEGKSRAQEHDFLNNGQEGL